MISNFSAGLLPPKESPPQRKNAKKEPPPLGGVLFGCFWVFWFWHVLSAHEVFPQLLPTWQRDGMFGIWQFFFIFLSWCACLLSETPRKKKLVSRVLWNPKVLPPQLLTEAKAKPINSYIFDHMSMNHTVPFMYQVDDAMSHMVTRESWPHSPNPYACPVCCRDVATVAPDRKAWCRDM